MRLFIAGGTGAIGRPLVRQAVADGHDVTVLVRSAEAAELVESAGGRPAQGDALDERQLRQALAAARPDAAINQLTRLATSARPSALKRGMADTGELRGRIGPVFVHAAVDAGVSRVISQSISFAYRPGIGVRNEGDPLFEDGPPAIQRVVHPLSVLERATADRKDIQGTVLRYGTLYGPGTYLEPHGLFVELVKKRRLPVVGQGRGLFGFVHVDDAVRATLTALDGPAGTYNIVDDEPVPSATWVRALAQMISAPSPRRTPVWTARLAAGAFTAYLMDRQPAVSNVAAKEQLGWTPSHPGWQAGFRNVLS